MIFIDPPILAAFTVLLVLLLVLLIARLTAAPKPNRRHSRRYDQQEDEPEFPAGRASYDMPTPVPADLPTRKLSPSRKQTTPPEERRPNLPPNPADVQNQEKEDPLGAAQGWQRLARWHRAAECYLRGGEKLKAARVYLSLQQRDQAIPLLREALKTSPSDEQTRLLLVEALFDEGEIDEARGLIEAVVKEDETGENASVSPQFIENAGRVMEACDLLKDAEHYYRLALRREDRLMEINQRVMLLRQLNRLGNRPDDSSDKGHAKEFLERFAYESRIDEDGLEKPPEAELSRGEDLTGHQIIVGHLALGFQQQEPVTTVGSVYALSRRYILESLVEKSRRSAVFRARDRLLDFPVALKLYRVPDDFTGMDLLKSRLLAVAHLNHPNLGKISFADREGRVIRLATEYLGGGDLREFLKKMGGVGLPLIIRMSMQIASGLHTAHLHGIIHGDIRPENILLGSDQRLKLVDFALSPLPVVPQPEDLEEAETEAPHLMTREKKQFQEGVRSDILQLADVLEFLIDNTRSGPDPFGPDKSSGTIDELRNIIQRIRDHSFNSVLPLWKELQSVFEKSLPSDSSTENPRLNL